MTKYFPAIIITYCRQCPYWHNIGTPTDQKFVCLNDDSPKDYHSKPDEYCFMSDYKEPEND